MWPRLSILFDHHLFCLLLTSTFLFSGCSLPRESDSLKTFSHDRPHAVYFVNYIGHSGIILNRQQAAPYLPALQNDFLPAQFLEFGWGDLEWYKADVADRSFWLQVRALFSSTPSAMFVWSLPKHPSLLYSQSQLAIAYISETSFKKLVDNINMSFIVDEKGKGILEKIASDRGGEYRTYLAKGRYHIFKNCNSWAEKMLRKSGVFFR